MKIKIKNYKILWQGEMRGRDRTIFLINPSEEDVRLAVWGKTFPYAIGQEIEGDIRVKPVEKNGKVYENKWFSPSTTQKKGTIDPEVHKLVFNIERDFSAVKELLERNYKILNDAKKELDELSKLVYSREFERQIQNYKSQREDNPDRVPE